MDNAEVKTSAQEVGIVAHRVQGDADVGMAVLEASQTSNQPARRQCGLAGNTDFTVGIGDLPCRLRHAGERGGEFRQERFTLGCKFDPLRLTAKKLDAKLFLQDLHMAADSSLADMQFQGCLGEALVTSCRLKGVERIQ